MSENKGPRWKTLSAKGLRVVLSGQGDWTVKHCQTKEEAEHIVRELHTWSKGERELVEFKSLCQAQ